MGQVHPYKNAWRVNGDIYWLFPVNAAAGKPKLALVCTKSLQMLPYSVITLPVGVCVCLSACETKAGCGGCKSSFLLVGVGQKSVSSAKALCIV